MATYCSKCGSPVSKNAEFCNRCGNSLSGKKPNAIVQNSKREKVLGRAVRRRARTQKLVIAALVLGSVGYLVYSNLPVAANPVIASQPVVTTQGSNRESVVSMFNTRATDGAKYITVPLDLLREKKLIAFEYSGPRGIVPLLAYVSGEGRVVTAVSVCEPCRSRRFHVRGTEIICNSCGTTWDLNTLEPVRGSCAKYPPDPLPNVVVGNEVRVEKDVVAHWQPRV